MSKPSMTAFAKRRIWALAFRLLICMILMICFVIEIRGSIGSFKDINYITGTIGFIVFTFASTLDSLAAIDAKRKGIPALKIYDDRLEFKPDIANENYDVYYFQDIRSVEVEGTEIVLTFVNYDYRKIDFNNLECNMNDFFDGIQAKYDAFRKVNPLVEDSGKQVRLKSVFCETSDIKGKIEKIRKWAEIIVIFFPFSLLPIREMMSSGFVEGWRGMDEDARNCSCVILIICIFFAALYVHQKLSKKNSNKKIKEKW